MSTNVLLNTHGVHGVHLRNRDVSLREDFLFRERFFVDVDVLEGQLPALQEVHCANAVVAAWEAHDDVGQFVSAAHETGNSLPIGPPICLATSCVSLWVWLSVRRL